MPIKRELRWFYPIDWKQLSSQVRFGRADGACEHCRRPHGRVVRCLPDGRWFDGARQGWRGANGQATGGPNGAEVGYLRETLVSLSAAHLDHDPGNNRMRNLRALCQRCHMLHDRAHHLARRWITYRQRRALGDLFLGPYHKILPHQVPVVLRTAVPRMSHCLSPMAARPRQGLNPQPSLPHSCPTSEHDLGVSRTTPAGTSEPLAACRTGVS